MNPRVRDLYKRFLVIGRDYPLGLASVREQVKAGFRAEQHRTSDAEINAAINKGRYYAREMIALIQLKKYRTLRGRYTDAESEQLSIPPPTDADLSRVESQKAEEVR